MLARAEQPAAPAPVVVVPYPECGLMMDAKDMMLSQWPATEFRLTSRRDPFAYASLLRDLWREAGDLVICEGDVVPPPGAIAQLLSCSDDWCTHPHWVGERYALDTFGLVKFSADLRRQLPNLADIIAARPDPRYWVRRGWTRIPRDCATAVLNGPGRKATLRPDAPAEAHIADYRYRPTTHDWIGLDTSMSKVLQGCGASPHVHLQPTRHLHDYALFPPGSRLPWHQREYDPAEWPD